MRAEDVLPDAVDRVEWQGVAIRKGTIAAFLANAAAWSDASTPPAARAEAQAHIAEVMPALRKLGFFDVMEVRDARLRDWIATL